MESSTSERSIAHAPAGSAGWPRNTRVALLAASVFGLLHVGALEAQVVYGRLVDDETGAGVADASVTLLDDDEDERGSYLTDGDGRFIFELPSPGSYRLRAERLGYGSVTSQFFDALERSDTLSVRFHVSTEAVLLDPLVVSVPRRFGGREIFERRCTPSRGVCLSPDVVDSIAPRTHPAELFRDIEDVYVSWGWGKYSEGGAGPIPGIRTFVGRGCLVYMIDNVRVRPDPFASGFWAGYPLNQLRPGDIEAVEFYRGAWEIPEEYRHLGSLSYRKLTDGGFRTVDMDLCGLVVFWTRAGW